MPDEPIRASTETRRAWALRIVGAAPTADSADHARLIDAFSAVPREDFVGPPPWQVSGEGAGLWTSEDEPEHLYRDVLVSLAHERGINNGQPSLHAMCLAALALQSGETVLHVGAGTGFYSAVIAELVGPQGTVHAYEIETDLAQAAQRNLASWAQVQVHAESATDGALPAADAVYVNAGATRPHPAWLDALRDGGRLCFPLTGAGGHGGMLLVTRRAGAWAARFIASVSFIGCAGARDDAEAQGLSNAFASGRGTAVRSLRRGSAPDQTAWVAGEGWWLSTAPPTSTL